MRQVWFAAMNVALLAGCSTIIEGQSQQITINTTPSGASCTLNREGAPLAVIAATPGSVAIRKTKDDIEVVCELDGYEKTAHLDESGTAAAVFGNILIGGAVGLVVDMSTGAANKYDSPLDIVLSPRMDQTPSAPSPAVASAPAAPVQQAAISRPVPAVSPAAMPVDLRRAENAADRYRVLSRLAADGLVPRDRYDAWAKQNVGAFLLNTAPPASVAVGNRAPSYEQLADFLGAVAVEKNRAVAEAERQALFGTLMTMQGPQAQPLKPPADSEGIRIWFAFLDRIRDDGLVSAESIEAEKTVINESRIAAGLAAVPVYSASADISVE